MSPGSEGPGPLFGGFRRYAALLVAASLAITGAGAAAYRQERAELGHDLGAQLAAVASLKLDWLGRWRAERHGDLGLLHDNPAFEDEARACLTAAGFSDACARVGAWLSRYDAYGEYTSAALVDPTGRAGVAVLSREPIAAPEREALAHVTPAQPIVWTPMFRDVGGHVRLALVLGLWGAPSDAGGGRALQGAAILRIDAERHVFPFLARWPTSSISAETHLVRRDGDAVLFLAPVHSDADAALRLRLPLAPESRVLSVLGALGGRGPVEGTDERGEVVVGRVDEVPGTDWLLVTHVDAHELSQALSGRFWSVAAYAGLLIVALVFLAILVWRAAKGRREREALERALSQQATARTLSDMLAHSPTVIYRMRIGARGPALTDITGNAERVLEYSLAEIMDPMWWPRHVHPDDLPLAAEAMARIRAGEAADNFYRFSRPDGGWRWLHDRLVPGDLQPDGSRDAVGALADVSAHRAAEDAHRIKHWAIASSAAPIVITDLDGTVTYVNRALAALWGLDHAEDAYGRALATFLAEDAATREALAALQAVGAFTGELKVRRPAGEPRTVIFSGSTVVDAHGRPLCRVATLTDISERKRADAEVHAALREREALLKEVHHRVKNNLQVITSLLRLESARSAQPDVTAVLREMQNRVIAMALLHEFLYRSETLAHVDLADYLARLGRQVFAAGLVTPTVRLQTDLAHVQVELDQAVPCGLLTNELLSNALKHAYPPGEPGEVRLGLRAARGDEGGAEEVCVEVEDDGAGLPADFEARAQQSLGLQMVRELTGQLGGRLIVTPGTAGVGARFRVVFRPRTSFQPAARPVTG